MDEAERMLKIGRILDSVAIDLAKATHYHHETCVEVLRLLPVPLAFETAENASRVGLSGAALLNAAESYGHKKI